MPPTLGAASVQRLVTNAVCPFRVDQQTATQNCMRNSSEPNSRARGSGVTMTSAAMTPPTIPMSQDVTATGRHPVRRKDLGNSIWLAPQHQTLETHRGPSSPRACGALRDLLSTAEAAAERPPQPTRPAKATPLAWPAPSENEGALVGTSVLSRACHSKQLGLGGNQSHCKCAQWKRLALDVVARW